MKRMRTVIAIVVASCFGAAWPSSVATCQPLPAPIEQALAKSKQLIVASTRKDGTLSEPAEVWFLYHHGKILLSSQTNAWRVRRIKAGRPRAKLWVENVDGPTFMATGKIVDDPKLRQLLLDTYAEKYKVE